MNRSTQEVIGLLYVSLAIAAGGRDLLKDSNDILRKAVEAGSVSRDASAAIKALVATTSPDRTVGAADSSAWSERN
jgi:hypothetical protein